MTFYFPGGYISDMGTIPSYKGLRDKTKETAEQELLWNINRMREHDSLRPLNQLPREIRQKIVRETN